MRGKLGRFLVEAVELVEVVEVVELVELVELVEVVDGVVGVGCVSVSVCLWPTMCLSPPSKSTNLATRTLPAMLGPASYPHPTLPTIFRSFLPADADPPQL